MLGSIEKNGRMEDGRNLPSEMILTASSFFKLFSVKSARKRSCKGTVPLMLRSAARRADKSLGETVIEEDRDKR